jgi:hypothetical protein
VIEFPLLVGTDLLFAPRAQEDLATLDAPSEVAETAAMFGRVALALAAVAYQPQPGSSISLGSAGTGVATGSASIISPSQELGGCGKASGS